MTVCDLGNSARGIDVPSLDEALPGVSSVQVSLRNSTMVSLGDGTNQCRPCSAGSLHFDSWVDMGTRDQMLRGRDCRIQMERWCLTDYCCVGGDKHDDILRNEA